MEVKDLDPVYLETFTGAPRKGDLRRFEIISVAIDLLAKEGPSLSFDQIAKHLVTRRSHISYYFKSRDDLLLAILKYITATGQSLTIQEIKKATTPRERILNMADAALLWAEKYPAQAKVLMFFYFTFSYSPEFKSLHSTIRATGLKRLESLLQALYADQPISQKSLAIVARGLQALITGLVVEQTTTKHSLNYRPVLRRLCLQLLHLDD